MRRTAVMGWLALGGAVARAEMPGKAPPDRERGRDVYARDCAACHGPTALGEGPAAAALGVPAPPLAGRAPVRAEAEQLRIILDGQGAMPGYAAVFDEADARKVLLWLRALDPATGADPDAKPPAKPPATPPTSPPAAPPAKAG